MLKSMTETFATRLQRVKNNKLQYFDDMVANTIIAKLQLTDNIVHICLNSTIREPENVYNVAKQCDLIFAFLTEDVESITDHETKDVEKEINRLQRMIQLYTITERVPSEKKQDIQELHKSVLDSLSPLVVFTGEVDQKVQHCLKEMNTKAKTMLMITDAERKEIVKAIGLSKGHWYKCPNGHPYAIADCGGAMVEVKCNECGAIIGGHNHTLAPGNQLAPEMDGAQHAAWSEGANMANYRWF